MDKLQNVVAGLRDHSSYGYLYNLTDVCTTNTLQASWSDLSSTIALVVGSGSLLLGIILFFNRVSQLLLGIGTDKTEPDKPFTNGVSYLFTLKLALQAKVSIDAIVKILSQRVRRRLYVAHKKWFFFGFETWWVGHPAIAAHVFGGSQQKMWRKLSSQETFNNKAGPNESMLFTGDDEGWRTARAHLTPFFYKYDFAQLDMDVVIREHLQRVATEHHGEGELLELLLTITVDLLCQFLYGCTLPLDELQILTECMAEYVAPGAINYTSSVYPGGLNSLDYHTKAANEMAVDAPEGTLAYIIKNCPSLSDHLKSENLAFFLEALTPAFASFWTICNISMMTQKDLREEAKTDHVYCQQCIKESIRMYPPVPLLWPRKATCDQEMVNPLYTAPPLQRSFFSKLFDPTPIEEQPTLKIKKDTVIILLPAVLHYDDRFWVRPMEFLPDRWDKEPDLLQGDNVKIEARNRKSQFPGLVGSKRDTFGKTSSRVSMLSSKARSEGFVSQSLRAKLFGKEHELQSSESAKDHLFESTHENTSELQKSSFLPFGAGPHTCMGRRLAIRMVESMVHNFLEYDVMFYNGVIPSLFTRKQWHERLVSTQSSYNFPADPVLIQLKQPITNAG